MDQQLFEQRFRDKVSPTKLTIWKNVKKYTTEGSSLDVIKDRSIRSPAGEQDVHRKR